MEEADNKSLICLSNYYIPTPPILFNYIWVEGYIWFLWKYEDLWIKQTNMELGV